MKHKGISFVFPVLNERIDTVLKTIEIAKTLCEKTNLDYEILLFDGGSDYMKVVKIYQIVRNMKYVKFYLNFPLIKPNKDIAIMNSVQVCKYENIIISDVDIVNLTCEHFNLLINDLIKGGEFAIPNLNRRGGRWNRLLGNPFMRLCFPEEYRKVPYPAPGILGIKKEVLRKIITNDDFFYDWGEKYRFQLKVLELLQK